MGTGVVVAVVPAAVAAVAVAKVEIAGMLG